MGRFLLFSARWTGDESYLEEEIVEERRSLAMTV
jgi:hypothetical protein